MGPTENYEEPIERFCDQEVCNKTLYDDMHRMNDVISNIEMLTSRLLLNMFGEKSKEQFDSSTSECLVDDIVKCVKNLEQIMRKLEKIDTKIG